MGRFWENRAKSPDFGPIFPKSALKMKIAPTAMVEKFRIIIGTCTYNTKRPDFFEVKKSALWIHFCCMHHCLGFVHRCMHHNAGEYGTTEFVKIQKYF